MIKLKTESELHAMAAAKGAQIRSRTKFIEDGEKNTSCFLNLEKRNAANYTITTLTREDGSIACSQADVLEQVNFYSTLYKEDTGLFMHTDLMHYRLSGGKLHSTSIKRSQQKHM